jgi:excisionase family DNA binding protein
MSDAQLPDAPASGEQSGNLKKTEWLTLKDASNFLGVHFTTLRAWADKGDIPVFRTPGGHRRFSLADLRRFLEERAGQAASADAGMLMDAAVGRVRQEIQKAPNQEMTWLHDLDDEARDLRRQRGRQLFSLAFAFVLKPNQRDRILVDGRRLGWEYGREAASSQVSLAETGRAVQFFRSQLIQAVQEEDGQGSMDADDVRIQRLLDRFLNEVLYAVLDGYERQLSELDEEADLGEDLTVIDVRPLNHLDDEPTGL